jgi:hypothetical protein
MNPIKEYLQVLDTLPWTRSQDGTWTMLTTVNWKAWNYGACEKLRAAQQSVQRIAFGAGAAGFLVGVVVTLIVVFVQLGVR